jgi:hypothetical protein
MFANTFTMSPVGPVGQACETREGSIALERKRGFLADEKAALKYLG